MKTNMKKMLVVLVAVAMVLGLAACGGSGSGSGSSSKGDGSSITVFNSKMEIQDQFVELAKQYTEETGVLVGDRILEIDNTRVYSARDLYYCLYRNNDGKFDIVLERNGERKERKHAFL